MEYLKPSFSVGVSRGVKDQDDFAKRWEETFGPGKKKPSPEEAIDELTEMYNSECGAGHE